MSYQKFTKDIGLITVVNFFVILRSIIFIPIITKLLGALNYGIWVQISITVGLLAPLVRLGLTNSIVRYLAAEKNKEDIQEGIYSTLFSITIASSLVFVLFILFSNSLTNFFQVPKILVLTVPLILLFECANMVLLTIFQALQEMLKYSFFTIGTSIGEIIFVTSSILLGYGLKGAVLSLLFVRIIIFLFLFFNIFKEFGFKIPQFNLFKKYISFGLPTLISNISYLFVTSIDKYLVGFFLGTLFVGYYAPAYSLGNLITFFIIPISFVLFPSVSKSYDEKKMHEVKNKLKYSLKYFLIIAIPAVFGISALIRQLLEIFTTKEIALHAFFVTPVIASSTLLYGISDIFSEIFVLVKKTKTVSLIWAAAAVVNVILNLFLISSLGILGAALATLFAYLFAFILIWLYSLKELTFEIDWQSIIKSLIASLLISVMILKIKPQNLLAILAVVLLSALIYFLLIFLMKTFEKKELVFLKNLIKRTTQSASNN